MSGNETTTEYRAVAIDQNGKRDEFAWTDQASAEDLARRFANRDRKGLRFYVDAVVEAREVTYGPVRVVNDGVRDVG